MKNFSDVNFFKENGYIIFKSLYSKEDCKSILKKLNFLADENYSQLLNIHRKDFLTLQTLNKIQNLKFLEDKHKYIKSLSGYADFFLKSFKKKIFVNKITKLYNNREIVGTQTQVIFKKPGSKYGKQQYLPHQDNSYAKNKNNLFFTTHLFLEKANMKNGTLYVHEKSHKLGLLKFDKVKSYGNEKKAGNKINVANLKKNFKTKVIKANIGDLLVMHGNLVHGSYVNKTKKKSRTTFSLCCIVKGENFVKGRNACRQVFNLK